MITIPQVLTYQDIVVYPDDKDCNLFYCIRTTPHINIQDGVPVFNGLFYTDKADGTMKSTSGIAGAIVNFDVNLGITPDEESELRQKIKDSGIQQKCHDAIKKKNQDRNYYRRGVKGDEKGGIDTTGESVPDIAEVRFGSIAFKEGNVELLEESKGDMVAWSSSGGRCSGFGNNNAAFSLRLTDMGGAVWYKALKERSKAFSIRYNLKFEVRVPALEIRMYAASHQESDIERSVERVWRNTDQGCTDADVERIDCQSVAQSLVDESLINIEITQGSTAIPLEDINNIRSSMVSLLQQKVEEIIKTKIQGMTREQMESSMIGKITEEINSFAELRFTQSSAIEWSVSPQGTILDFMKDVDDDALGRVIKVVDLSDNEFATDEIRVQVVAPWDEEPFVTGVSVIMDYPSAGESESFSLDKVEPQKSWFVRKPKNGNNVVKYSTLVYLRDHTEPYNLGTKQSTGHVFVNVGKIGMADLTFAPHPMMTALTGNNKVTSITVDTKYYPTKEDRLADVNDISDSFVIPTEKPEPYRYLKNYGVPLTEPLLYTVTYYFKNRAPIVTKTEQFYFTNDNSAQIITPAPFEDSLELNVEVSGKIKKNESIERAIVSFRYSDSDNDFESSSSVTLAKEDKWDTVRASLVVMDKSKQKFQYKCTFILADDDPYMTDWMEGEGEEETLVLSLPEMLTVDTGLFGEAGKDYYRGDLNIKFLNEKFEDIDLEFSSDDNKKVRKVALPERTNDEPLKFSYTFTYSDMDGNELDMEGEKTGKLLLIAKPKPEGDPTEKKEEKAAEKNE